MTLPLSPGATANTIGEPLPRRSAVRSSASWPTVAGLTYVGAWLVGLTAFGTGPAAGATDATVTRYVADHRLETAMQSLLIHGVAALALAAVLLAVARSQASTRTSVVAGAVGVGASLVQCGLGLWRSLVSAGSATATLTEGINRIDGLKMAAFAVMIGSSIAALRGGGWIGRRMALTGTGATIALAVSAIAYGAAITPRLATAAVALVLLLAWVAHLGAAAGRHRA
jgi:hypothetical protein